MKTLLWKRERAQRREEERESTLTDLEAQLKQQQHDHQNEQDEQSQAAAAQLRKQIGSQRGQQKRAAGKIKKWEHKIQTQHERIDQINRQLKETSAEESRLEQMIEREAVKMKGSRKRLMDALKILARNLFYIMLGPFKADYDNYRDDHVIFRSLTTSGGLIEADEHQVTCHILLEPDYPRAIRRNLENYLRDWNENSPQFPDGSRRPITLKLITSERLQVALPQAPFMPNH